MADTKITALTALTAADPANDVIPIVDVSDTSMAASGTTKKISVNNILGASGTATLASATITGAATVGTTLGVTGVSTLASAVVTGDLTVDTSTLVVDSTNNRVGIGTATPATNLHIINDTAATNSAVDVLTITQSSTGTAAAGLGGGVLFKSERPSGGLILNRGAIYGVSGTDPDDDGDLAFYTLTNTGASGFTEKVRIDSTGNIVMKIANTGIDFSAVTGGTGTATANVLNDYEEGTWVGTLTGSTTNPTVPVTATGRYTKIGRVVTVQIFYSNVSTVGASGSIGITGLPFANSTVQSVGAVSLYQIGTFTGSTFSIIDSSNSSIEFNSNISGSVYGNVTHNAGIARYMTTSITYTVA